MDKPTFPLRIRMSGKQYDDAQTKACDDLRTRLQSVAVLSVQAQEAIGDCDRCNDLLDDVDRDLTMARHLANKLALDEFDEYLERDKWEDEVRDLINETYSACSDGFDMERASKATFVDIILDQLGNHCRENHFRTLRILEAFRAMPKTWQRKFIADCQ